VAVPLTNKLDVQPGNRDLPWLQKRSAARDKARITACLPAARQGCW
jgi:hypothetical protein